MTGRIFVLGLQRSGTTWLANMLAALPEVAAVAHEDHQGVHESVFFSHFARNFGPWDDAEAKARFFEAFGQSDYFRLTGLDRGALTALSDRCHSYGSVFVAVMDLVAERAGASHWVEKSPHHTLLSADILRAVPDAQFIMVERALPELVASRLHGFGRTPTRSVKFWRDVVRGTLTATLYRREMRRLASSGQGLLVQYSALKDDPQGRTRQRILDYLNIDADPTEMVSAYRPNSSFKGKTKVALGAIARVVIATVAFCASLVPLVLLHRIQARRDAQRGSDWPDWVWTQTGYHPD